MKNVFILVLVSILFSANGFSQKTIIKGKVHNWKDTIYLQTMPFHSPYSTELKAQKITKDSTFNFEFENIDKPLIVQLYFNRKSVKINREQLLFLNLTNEYYYGHCVKFYTYDATTFLIEPNTTINVDLKRNSSIVKLKPEVAEKYRKLGANVSKDDTVEDMQKTEISFTGANKFQHEYFQKSFDLDNIVDRRLRIYETKPINEAVIGYKKVKKQLLDKLETNKDKLSPIFYDYIKAEIEFGAKKEFLKYLMFSKEKEMDAFFAKEIPKEIMDIIVLDKTKVNATTIINEEYNKYLNLYLTFILNFKNKSYKIYYDYDITKIQMAIKNFPEESVYYFLANYLLAPKNNREEMMKTIKIEDAVEELIVKTITKHPNGELNDRIMKKYDL